MLIHEKISDPDTLLKLYMAIDEDLKALQPHLRANSGLIQMKTAVVVLHLFRHRFSAVRPAVLFESPI